MKLLAFVLSLLPFPFGLCFVDATFGGEEGTASQEDAWSKLQFLPPKARILAGSYILVLRDDEPAMNAVEEILSMDYEATGKIQYMYSSVLVGAAVTGVSTSSLKRLLESSHVLSITPDYSFDLDSVQEFPISWGLDRIDDEEDKPLDGKYEYEYTGYGVDVYILDSGLYEGHSEFSTATSAFGRDPRTVNCGYDAFATPNDNVNPFDGQCSDNIGHGTHVSAILGGRQLGVSKDANLISVKVYDSIFRGASLSTILAGLDFVFSEKSANPTKPTVALLAVSGPISEIIHAAVESVVDAGVVVVVSAGNDGESSCSKSPPSSAKVITVTATDFQDVKPAYAGDGPCTTIYAPGHQITSAWIRDDMDVVRLSGTSMAAAHVAGVAAQYLEKFPHWNPHEVSTALTVHAIRGAVTDENANNWTPNLLLNTRDLNDAV